MKNKEEEKILDYVSMAIDIYNQHVFYSISQQISEIKDMEIIINNTIKQNNKLFKKIFHKNNDNSYEKLNIISYFFQTLRTKKIDISTFNTIMDIFSRKVFLKKINNNDIKKKMFHQKNYLYLKYYTPLKFVNWLFDV